MPNQSDATEWLAGAFREIDRPISPYLQLGGFLYPLAKAIKDAPQEAKLEVVREQLPHRIWPKSSDSLGPALAAKN